MADSSRMADGRGSQRAETSGRSTPSSMSENARERPNGESSGGTHTSGSGGVRGGARLPTYLDGPGLRPQESRASLNEQFATSRREFDFEEDEEPLEPAPIIDLSWSGAQDDTEAVDEDMTYDVSDDTIRRLLQANEDVYDYYTLLGLSRQPPPTVSEIRAAYHRLSLAFHPDKHPHVLKAAAQKYFTRLQKAYETLIEPRKRVIYDLEGEEGVQNEYKVGGAMGQGGEGERRIGVKTMEAEEFKKWFMGVLLERERRAIGELVGTNGTCKLLLNAHNLISGPQIMRFRLLDNDEAELLEFPAPLILAQSLQLRQSFSVPLPGIGKLLLSQLPPWRGERHQESLREFEEEDENMKSSWESSVGPYVPTLTFTGAIAGTLEKQLAVSLSDEEQPKELRPLPQDWYVLNSENVQLSARLEHSFPEVRDRKKADSIASAMQGIDLDINTRLFPKRTLNVGLGRPFTILEDTRPFYCHLRTFFNHPITLKPPVVDLRVSRSLGDRQTGYCHWSSGDFGWPASLRETNFLPVSKASLWLPRGRLMPNMRIGYLWTEATAKLINIDEDDDMQIQEASDEIDEKASASKHLSTNQSWHLAADSSPYNAKCTVMWGRDLFVRKPENPIRSRVMKGGETVPRSGSFEIPAPRGVRLELEGELNLNLSFGGTVRGIRRVGKFTSIGVGIGLNVDRGLFISLSWSRLGQNIILPVLLLSDDEVDLKSVFLALAIPWATYAAVEFAILRPRLRKKRLLLAERKRRELRENVIKRRSEAEQAVVLMRPLVEHRQAVEREQGGLAILKAEYGVRSPGPDSTPSWRLGEVADVTVALAALVDGGQLSLPKGLHKSQIIGFWDPAPLKKKELIVDYLFAGKRHHVEILRNEGLSIPMRAHEI